MPPAMHEENDGASAVADSGKENYVRQSYSPEYACGTLA